MLYAYMRETHERPIAICTPRSQLCALFFALLSLGVQSARAQDPLIATENRSASIVARESKAPERFVVGCDSGDITIEIDATLTDSRVEAVFQLVGRSASDLANRKATIRLFATRTADDFIVVEPVLPDGIRAGERVDIIVRTFAAGDTSMRAKSGAMKATGVRGKLRLRGGNGAVMLRECVGPIDVHSAHGAVDIQDATSDVHIASKYAPVSLRYAEGADAEFKIETTNGPVTVSVSAAYDGAATLRTTAGGIVLHDTAKRMRTPRIGDTVAQVELGAGVAQSIVETSNGTVVFEARAAVVAPTTAPK